MTDSAVAHPIRWPRMTLTDGRAAGRLHEAAIGVTVGIAAAAAVSYAPVTRPVLVAVVGCLVAGLLLFASPTFGAVLLGASLPALQDLTGGRSGLHVAASDIVLVLFAVRLLADAAVSQRLPIVRALRPVRFPVVQYACLIGLLLVLHPGFVPVLKSTQRLELIVLPLLVGAYVALRKDHMLVLRVYVLATTALAVVWPVLDSLGLQGQWQKNPTGQLIANALLLLVAVRGLRPLLPCMPLLVAGLALTTSRGAILAVIPGIAVISLMYGGRNLRIVIPRTLLILLAALAIYQWLPEDVRSHVTNYSTAAGATSSYPIYVREQYEQDAKRLIAAHPWTGVGVDNYLAGDSAVGTSTTDPHNVVLLQAAEGGYVFAASFVLLIAGAAFALWRMRRVELSAVAVAVLVATVAHGLVDVYWVRGTPVLGWLLVGMVCGLAAARKMESST